MIYAGFLSFFCLGLVGGPDVWVDIRPVVDVRVEARDNVGLRCSLEVVIGPGKQPPRC